MKNCREVEPLLTPYVDGEGAPDDRAAVAEHIAACDCCRDEVSAQRAARDVLQARRGGLRNCASARLRARCAAHAQVPSGSSRKPQGPYVASAPDIVASGFSRKILPDPVASGFSRKILRRLPIAAAATIVLAVGGVFGLGLNNRVQALALQMTLDHVKCARFNNSTTPEDPVAAAQRWTAKFGWPLTVPPSSEPAGLELRAVRRCGVTDGRVAHLIYQWHGQPLSVYVLPSKALEGSAKVERFGHDSVMWSQNGRTYVVLASASRRLELDGVVQYVRANVY